ncbi:hypothetical protein PFLU4_57440 [Pseudomonas fluorescens]|nr:hypothetical protein PFLU4_57440 [Pseudomonas fluorescens]
MASGPGVVLTGEGQAQGIVVGNQCLQRLLQMSGVHWPQPFEQHRLVPVMRLGHVLFEKQLLERQQHRVARHRALVDARAAVPLVRHAGEALDGLVDEQILGTEMNPGLPRPADHLDRDNRIAPQLEEVVTHPHLLASEHALPDRGQGLFEGGDRCDVSLGAGADIGFGQCLAFQFAVGADGHFFQPHPVLRHHVVGQGLAQMVLEATLQRLADGVFGAQQFSAGWHQVGHQQGAVLGDDDGFAHLGVLGQAHFDFPQLNAQATDFHLMVHAPGVFNHAIGAIARQVTGAIQPLPRAEGAGHEAFGGQRRASMVTPGQALARQVQLARHTDRHGRQFIVQDVSTQVGNRLADRHAVATVLDTGPMGDVDGCLGRTVEVVQAGVRQFGEHLLLRIHRQGFAAAHDPLQAGALGHVWVLHKRLQHRRHEVQRGDALRGDQLDQLRRVAMSARRGHHQRRAGQQRPEELPHRYVETERRFLQHAVRGIEPIGLLHPAQPIDQGRMTIARALGLAGGTGGVDHVGQVFSVNVDARIGIATCLQPVLGLIQHQTANGLRNGQRVQ